LFINLGCLPKRYGSTSRSVRCNEARTRSGSSWRTARR
jgi:hypothetical protein